MEPERNLTDDDVDAIVSELKRQLVRDFYGEVGRGVWGWVSKAFWALMLIAAVYGIASDKGFIQSMAAVK